MTAAIEEIIPHREPMRFVDALTDCAETTATATARFSSSHFAVADGTVMEGALVECMAQTVAAALGWRRRAGGNAAGAANNGMLAAVSNFKFIAPPPLDQLLTIKIREVKRLGPMLRIEGSVFHGAELIAAGELSLYA
jgi:predicted hotdog family 3-hydroxylacyl-ACP dehydratase